METHVDAQLYAEACHLLAEFGWRVDNGEGDTVADLFVEDALVETPHFRLEGRQAIHDWFSVRAPKNGARLSRHHSLNLRVRPLDGDRLEILANALTVVGEAPAPAHGGAVAIGTSHDVVRRTADGLRFESRILTLAFEGRISPPEAKA